MSLIDLLRMSSSNLRRRKLRTFLTVLGVLIGTASIVVMISLGLGMQRESLKQMEASGGLTTIDVLPMEKGSQGSTNKPSEQMDTYITDKVIDTLKTIPHVSLATPVLSSDVILIKGSYEGYFSVKGMTKEGLEKEKISMTQGSRFPKKVGNGLEMIIGNGVITGMSDKQGNPAYEDGKPPKVHFDKDTIFYVLDTEGYQNSSSPIQPGESSDNGTGGVKKPVKKYLLHTVGMVEGTPDHMSSHSYDIYCDLQALKTQLTKEFSGRVIPGQPTTKAGKPLKNMVYSSAKVYVDDMNHMEEVTKAIRNLGYEANSNLEWLESSKKQSAVIQAVLGGIGGVSLLVAAIGIANTMMMSIYERTKEIGVMKVLGCDMKNIQQMFLLEAGGIGLMGGIIGNLVSFLMSMGINKLVSVKGDLGMDTAISYIPPWLVLLSILFAIFVGMLAGFFPARRAMKLSPLAAIRNE